MSPDLRIQRFVPAALGGRAGVNAGAESGTGEDSRANAGHAAGYAAGYAAGARAAAEQAEADRLRLAGEHERREQVRDAELQRAIAALADTAAQWERRAVPVLAEAEVQIHSAALQLAEAIVARELQPGPASALNALERALSAPADATPIRIRLCPSDLPHAQRAVDEGDAALPAGVSLVADPALNPGDAVAEFQDGSLDARIGSALQRVRRALLDEEEK